MWISSRINQFHRREWWSTRTIAVLIHSFQFISHVSWGAMQQTKNCHGYVIFCQSECWSWISLLCDGRKSKCILLLIDWNGFCNGTRWWRHDFECTPCERRITQEGEGLTKMCSRIWAQSHASWSLYSIPYQCDACAWVTNISIQLRLREVFCNQQSRCHLLHSNAHTIGEIIMDNYQPMAEYFIESDSLGTSLALRQ